MASIARTQMGQKTLDSARSCSMTSQVFKYASVTRIACGKRGIEGESGLRTERKYNGKCVHYTAIMGLALVDRDVQQLV